MKEEMIKGLTILVVTVAFATAVVSANGQSSVQVRADIPFEFTIGDKTLPAGTYGVRSASNAGDVLMIQNSESSISSFRLTNPIEPKRSKPPRLVFHRYGQTYFLAEVWKGGESVGRKLLPSSKERAMKRELSNLAQNNYEIVEIVATLQ